VEQLEDRTVLSSYTAASVSVLVADINAANAAGGANTITLAPGKTFTLTSGELYIAANDNLTIIGNNDTIQRSTAGKTPDFRLFEVSAGASLTLSDMTLTGGMARGRDGTRGAAGGDGLGGGILVEGTANLTNVTLSGNTAQGGNGSSQLFEPSNRPVGPGAGGNGLGGGIYVDNGGSLTMHLCSASGNKAIGGSGGTIYGTKASDGVGEGAALYLNAGAAVFIDAATLAKISISDIYGTYTPIP
jgi:hypothetical protein